MRGLQPKTGMLLCLWWTVLLLQSGLAADVGGDITMEAVASDVTPGMTLAFTFDVTLAITGDVQVTNVRFYGDSLSFSAEVGAEAVTWNLEDVTLTSGPILTRDSPMLEFNESLSDGEDKFQLDFANLPVTTWRLFGNFSMEVPGTTPPGSVVRSIADVTFFADDVLLKQGYVTSDYLYTPPPTISISEASPGYVPIMSELVVSMTFTFEEETMNPRVEMMTPHEESSREVMITVQSLKVTSGQGLTLDSGVRANSSQDSLYSTLGSYQEDLGVLLLPLLSRDGGYTDAQVSVQLAGRVEDYSTMTNGSMLWVGAGLQFGLDMIWVSSANVTLSVPDPDHRRPYLTFALSQTQLCAYDGSQSMTLVASISHENVSTATAYDVRLNMYLPDWLLLQTKTYVTPKGFTLEIGQLGSTAFAQIERLTFSDPMTITLLEVVNVSRQLDLALPDSAVVSAELLYTDRWKNDSEFSTKMKYIRIRTNSKCSERVRWVEDMNCTCQHNASRQDCACCFQGGCQCGPALPEVCVPCNRKWRCLKVMEGYHGVHVLKDGSYGEYQCDAHQQYSHGSTGTSCLQKVTSTLWREVAAVVGKVVGRDAASGVVYAISNNGLGYLASSDHGLSWQGIRATDFQAARGQASYVAATAV